MKRIAPLLLSLVVLTLSTLALAASAQSYLEAKQKELTVLIKKPSTPAVDSQLTATFDAILDYDALAEESLGAMWAERSADERKEFQALLTTLVQSAYKKNIRNTLDYNINFAGSQPAKKGQLVQTVAKHKTDARKEPIHIDYLVHQVGGQWRVYDIITEGSSLVGNYNSQFRSIVKKHGFADLLSRMRKKAEQES